MRAKLLVTVISLAAVVLILLAGTGCDAITPKKTVLRIADWGGAGDDDDFARLQRQLREEFEAANPDVDVQIEHIPGSQEYVRKMLLNFIAGAEPDIMVLDASSAAVFMQNGVLKDLTPLAAADPTFKWDDYYPNVLEIAKRGDAMYAVPNDFTPMVMYYNKRIFDTANIKYPGTGWTWENFVQKARTLTKLDQPQPQFGFAFSNWMPGWIMFLWNNGADVLSPDGKRASGYFDSIRSVKAIEFVRDLIERHKVAPSLSQSAALGVDLFLNGQAAMVISGHWQMVGVLAKDANGKYINKIRPEDVGIVELPSNVGTSSTVMYETGLAMGKNCRHPEVAWRYIKFMTSYPVQKRYNATGIAVCARKDVSQERATNDLEREFLRIVPSARPPWGSKVEGYDYVETIGQKMMDNVLNAHLPVPQSLKQACREIEGDFAKR